MNQAPSTAMQFMQLASKVQSVVPRSVATGVETPASTMGQMFKGLPVTMADLKELRGMYAELQALFKGEAGETGATPPMKKFIVDCPDPKCRCALTSEYIRRNMRPVSGE